MQVLLLAVPEELAQPARLAGPVATDLLWTKMGVVSPIADTAVAERSAQDAGYKRKQEAKEAGIPTVTAMTSLSPALTLGRDIVGLVFSPRQCSCWRRVWPRGGAGALARQCTSERAASMLRRTYVGCGVMYITRDM